LIFHKRIPPV